MFITVTVYNVSVVFLRHSVDHPAAYSMHVNGSESASVQISNTRCARHPGIKWQWKGNC